MKTDSPGSRPRTTFGPAEVPPGVDRRTFLMRSAVIGSAAVITGCTPTEKEQTAAARRRRPRPKGCRPTSTS